MDRMGRLQTIESICSHNRGVDAQYLAGFSDEDLSAYLARLTQLQGQRGSRWVRDGSQRAITVRDIDAKSRPAA